METVRIVPCLDVDNGRVVKGVNFVGLRDAGDPVELAARYDSEGADELVFLDITASSDARETTLDMVRHVAEEVFIPFTVGGGIRTVDDARGILRAGADKVSVNTAAVEHPALVGDLAAEFGSQCVGSGCGRATSRSGQRSRLQWVRGVYPRWSDVDRTGPRSLDCRGRRPGSRRDPVDVDGPRRHP